MSHTCGLKIITVLLLADADCLNLYGDGENRNLRPAARANLHGSGPVPSYRAEHAHSSFYTMVEENNYTTLYCKYNKKCILPGQ